MSPCILADSFFCFSGEIPPVGGFAYSGRLTAVKMFVLRA
jgi:hypothetical protein